jgi:hypothetical protein
MDRVFVVKFFIFVISSRLIFIGLLQLIFAYKVFVGLFMEIIRKVLIILSGMKEIDSVNSYDEDFHNQIKEQVHARGKGSIKDLLHSGETWEVN